jgi:hypothetical protein
MIRAATLILRHADFPKTGCSPADTSPSAALPQLRRQANHRVLAPFAAPLSQMRTSIGAG